MEFIARRTLLDQMIDLSYGTCLSRAWAGPGDRSRCLNQRVRLLVGLPAHGKRPKRSAIVDFRRRLLATGPHMLAFRQQQLFLAHAGLVDQAAPPTIDSTPYLTAAAQSTGVGLIQHARRRFWLALHNWDAALAAQIRDLLHLEAWCQPHFQRCSASLHSGQGRHLWPQYFQFRILTCAGSQKDAPELAISMNV